MVRRIQIAVIGYGEDLCTEEAYEAAYEVGYEAARAGAIVVNGGLGGVMEASSKGAREGGGLTVGIVPAEDVSQANVYCDAVVATGVGYARNFFVAYSGDAIIIVGGAAGTIIEAAAAYLKGKPIIAVKGTGGAADELSERYIDGRKAVRVEAALSSKEAVQKAVERTRKP